MGGFKAGEPGAAFISATKVLDRLRMVVTVPCNFNCLADFFD